MVSRRWTISVCEKCGEEPSETRLERDLTLTHSRGMLDPEACGGRVERIEVIPLSDALSAIEEAVAELEKRGEEADKVASESTDTPMFSIPYAHRGECNREAASLLRTHLDRLREKGGA